MQLIESRFRKPHPALEGFKEPLPEFAWLVNSYFRLHRRRQYSDMGTMKALSYGEMSLFYGNVLRFDRSLEPLFFRCMEATDNAVLEDYSEKVKKQNKEAEDKANAGPKGRQRSKPR